MKDYKKYKKARKENNLAKTAQVSGAGIATIGGGALVAKKVLDSNKIIKAANSGNAIVKSEDKVLKTLGRGERGAKALKKVGVVALPVGAALTVGGTILKKKSDKKLKEYGDDSKKK